MNVSLTPELEQFVEHKVASGMFQTASDVVREGLRLLAERDKGLESLRKDIQDGVDAIERGEYTDYDEEGLKQLIERISTDGRKRWEAERAISTRK